MNKKGAIILWIIIGVFILSLISVGFFLISEKNKPAEGSEGDLKSLQCEQVISKNFLQDTFDKSFVKYTRSDSIKGDGNLFVDCIFETSEENSKLSVAIVITAANITSYENHLNKLKSLTRGSFNLVEDVGSRAFFWMLSESLSKHIYYNLITSDNKYWIEIILSTNPDVDSISYAKTLANKINSNL